MAKGRRKAINTPINTATNKQTKTEPHMDQHINNTTPPHNRTPCCAWYDNGTRYNLSQCTSLTSFLRSGSRDAMSCSEYREGSTQTLGSQAVG
eukprot:m.246819 g.246819  ORF g.246819 m.246819 type:complete len:93 (-) comp15387_c0_seq1:1932-2210(-)